MIKAYTDGYIDVKCQMHDAIFCCFHYGVEEGVIWRESAARPSVKWRLGEAGEKRSEIRNCQLVPNQKQSR